MGNTRLPASWEICVQVKKQQLELDMEQQTDSKLRKFFKRWEYQTTQPASWEICMQVKKQKLEPDMEQTESK